MQLIILIKIFQQLHIAFSIKWAFLRFAYKALYNLTPAYLFSSIAKSFNPAFKNNFSSGQLGVFKYTMCSRAT